MASHDPPEAQSKTDGNEEDSEGQQSAAYRASVKLFREEKYTDVVIRCGDRTWKCHKAILCSRSAFFRACFDSNFKESSTNELHLDDDYPNHLDEVLLFLYTAEIPQLKFSQEDIGMVAACELFVIADKYGTLPLRDFAAKACLECLKVMRLRTKARLPTIVLKPECRKVFEERLVDCPEWTEFLEGTLVPHLLHASRLFYSLHQEGSEDLKRAWMEHLAISMPFVLHHTGIQNLLQEIPELMLHLMKEFVNRRADLEA